MIVAIDGPAGAGKSTVSGRLARRLGLALVDTGAIYRCVALEASRAGLSYEDDRALERLLPGLQISFRWEGDQNRVLLAGKDVTEAIRTPEISLGASAVSARPVVRKGLLELQRRLARATPLGAVLEGRDIGTVVFPDAELKVFLTASPEVRAQRRFEELKAKGVQTRIDQVLKEQQQRDQDDSTRAVAPLRVASDAVVYDTSSKPFEQVVDELEALARERSGP